MRKLLCSPVGTVPAYHNYSVYAVLSANFCRLLYTLIGFKFFTARCTQYGSAKAYYLRNGMPVHINDLFVDKSLISLLYTFYRHAVSDSLSYHSSYRCIHSR